MIRQNEAEPLLWLEPASDTASRCAQLSVDPDKQRDDDAEASGNDRSDNADDVGEDERHGSEHGHATDDEQGVEEESHGSHCADSAPSGEAPTTARLGDYSGPAIPDGFEDVVRRRVESYVADILEGRVRAGKRIKQAAARWNATLADPRFRMDWAAAARVVFFLEALKLSDEGETVPLQPWQVWHASACYGLKWADSGRRVIRLSVVQMGRGGGKSTYTGGLVLYEFIWGGPGIRAHVVANKLDQTRIVFQAASNALAKSFPELSEECQRHNKLVDHERNVEFTMVVAKEKTLDGLKPRFWIGDEASEWRGRFLTKLLTAANKMPVCLGVIVTTPGDNADLIYTAEVVETAHRVLDGELDLPSDFYLLFGMDEEDEPDDEASWWKANPGFPTLPPIESVRDGWQKAKLKPVTRGEFIRYHGSRFSRLASRWLDMSYWDEGSPPVNLDELKGRPAWLGLDLSKAFDLCALSGVIPLDDGRFALFGRYWWPEESARNREVEWSLPLRQWASEGRLKLTPGPSIAYGAVLDELLSLRRILDVRLLLFDPWNAGYFAETLIAEHHYPAKQYRLTDANFVPGCQFFQQAWVRRELVHGNDPILRRCCADAAAKEFSTGYARIIKSGKTAIIDGLVSAVLAVHGWRSTCNEQGSSYGRDRSPVVPLM